MPGDYIADIFNRPGNVCEIVDLDSAKVEKEHLGVKVFGKELLERPSEYHDQNIDYSIQQQKKAGEKVGIPKILYPQENQWQMFFDTGRAKLSERITYSVLTESPAQTIAWRLVISSLTIQHECFEEILGSNVKFDFSTSYNSPFSSLNRKILNPGIMVCATYYPFALSCSIWRAFLRSMKITANAIAKEIAERGGLSKFQYGIITKMQKVFDNAEQKPDGTKEGSDQEQSEEDDGKNPA